MPGGSYVPVPQSSYFVQWTGDNTEEITAVGSRGVWHYEFWMSLDGQSMLIQEIGTDHEYRVSMNGYVGFENEQMYRVVSAYDQATFEQQWASTIDQTND